MRQCKTIIAIDRSASRLELAKSLGATHLIDTTDSSIDLVAEVMRVTEGRGVQVSLDTTGVQSLARQSWDFVRKRGKILQVGLAKPGDKWEIPMAEHMNSGKEIIGCLEGDSVPDKFIPEMIGWYREGKFPIHRIVSLYPAKEYGRALEEMRQGSAVKPVLDWTGALI